MSYQFPEEFKKIISSSQYFLMNQDSSILEQNKYNHVSFLGKTKINDILEKKMPLLNLKNTILKDKHMELFFCKNDLEHNPELFENKTNYTLVENFSDLFNGLLRVEDYYILVNSDHKKFYVYTLLDNNSDNFKRVNNKIVDLEFYGFAKLGYLIDPTGYSQENIINFENHYNFKFRESVKKHLLNTSILVYENKLFYINLDIDSEVSKQVKNKSKLIDQKIINSDNLSLDGFLEIGIIDIKHGVNSETNENYLEYKKTVQLLVNHTDNQEYEKSIWTYTYENNSSILECKSTL
jgi:hypothetical protein